MCSYKLVRTLNGIFDELWEADCGVIWSEKFVGDPVLTTPYPLHFLCVLLLGNPPGSHSEEPQRNSHFWKDRKY